MRVELGGSSPVAAVERPPPARAARPFVQILEQAAGRPVAPPAAAPSLAAAVARAADAERTVDALLAAAARGRTFTPAQLLALQATVARGAQAVEVLSRAADRVVGTVKQTLNGQI